MDQFIGGLIAFVVGDYYVTLAVIGLVIALIVAGVRHRWRDGSGWRTILDWWTLFAVGAANLVNFYFHSVLGDFSAEQIGWPQSPFQFELALASLGIGIAAVIAFPRRMGWPAKLIANVPHVVFVLGAGIVHLVDIIATGNMAFGNAGPIFWSDFYLPIATVLVLMLAGLEARRPARAAVGAGESGL
ncbi:MAG: hypothetical protein BGO95_05215 [Micrococcales bacterium 73-13]|nr:MAG: hypothetical protein BGO95_05215 [Micrococcales bacterium 73-13]